MLRRLSYHFITVFFILTFSELKAQIDFNFSPTIYGQTLEGLQYTQIINSSGFDLKGFVTVKVRQIFENCFVSKIQPLTPLLLIDPVDGDELCNKRPNFLWQPPMPLPASAKFRLIVTEVKEKQDIAEALGYNLPVINQANLFGNNLLYPSNAPDLKEGQTYTWQVIVYTPKTILSKSELWTFKIKCNEKKPELNTDSYRELKETDDGNFYVANKSLRFSFNNAYNSGELSYSIENLSDSRSAIMNLPKLKMYAGLNKCDLDLSEYRAFKNGQEYLLKVKLINRELRLRFIYKDE